MFSRTDHPRLKQRRVSGAARQAAVHPPAAPVQAPARHRTGVGLSSGLSSLGLATGAVLMYFLDPDKGRRRRALLRDQFRHAGKRLGSAPGVVYRDVSGRSAGLWAGLMRPMRAWSAGSPSDRVLAERVRSRIGRVVSHPHAIDVEASDGRVTLRGPILAAEVERLLNRVHHVPGVSQVENRLESYEDPSHVPSLQGGAGTREQDQDRARPRWSPTLRLLGGTLGAGLMASSARGRGLLDAAMLVGGGALMFRAATNRRLKTLVGMGEPNAIDVEKSIHVAAPVSEVFGFWMNYENFPRFMSKVKEVRALEGDRSHWVVQGPAGLSVEWTAQVRRAVPDELIAWCTDGRSTVQHSGAVRFREEGEGTRVQVQLRYWPPGGAAGHALASLFGADPKSDMHADLMRMKQVIEDGASRREPEHDSHDALDRLERERQRVEELARLAESRGGASTQEGPTTH